jgi:hypothetical protein
MIKKDVYDVLDVGRNCFTKEGQQLVENGYNALIKAFNTLSYNEVKAIYDVENQREFDLFTMIESILEEKKK